MNITGIQWFLIILALLGALSGSTAQMTDLFGAVVAKDIASGASFLSSLISAILIPLNGQGSLVKTVAAMPGVEKVLVNQNATQTLAQVAISNDPAAIKVEATPGDAVAVTNIAEGTKK
jgi:hypothetical protein